MAARDGEETKRRILSAAEELFAEKGFDGTTIREVAERSGLSGPLILFHFQSKEGLCEAVKDAIVRRWQADLGGTFVPKGAAGAFVETMIEAAFAFYRDNPTMVRIANWGRLAGDDAPWGGEEEIHRWYRASLVEAQRRQEIRDDISPLAITALISGAVHVWWEFRGHMEEHVRQGSYDPISDDAYLDQITSVIRRGLAPREGSEEKEA